MKVLIKYLLNGKEYEAEYESDCLTRFASGQRFKRESGYPDYAIKILSVEENM